MTGERRKGLLGKLWRVGLAVVLLAAVHSLGSPGTYWGLPNDIHYFSYHPDEIFLLLPSFRFAVGEWNPGFFNYGTLYIYLVGLQAVALGLVPDPASFPAGLRPLYEQGRMTTAVLGTLTVLLLYFALRRESRRVAAVAAALLAVCPLHVVHRSYATVDVPATFLITAALLLALRGADRPHAAMGALTGLAVGLAAATKYNAGLFIIPALLAPYVARPVRGGWQWWVAVPVGAAVGFLIGCPHVGSPELWQGLRFELEHMRVGGTLAFVGMGPGWAYHLTHGLPVGLGFPLLAAVALGVPLALRLPGRAARLSLLWFVLYLGVIGFAKEMFIRYLVPLTPFLCVLAAGGLVWLWRRPRTRLLRAAAATVGLAVVALTACYCIGQVAPLVRFDPRDRAWGMVTIADIASATAAEHRIGLVQEPWFFHPPVSPFNAGAYSAGAFREWNYQTGSRVVVTGWDTEHLNVEQPGIFFLSDLESRDVLRLRTAGAQEFVDALDEAYPIKREYARPTPSFSWLAPGRDWAPPDWLYASPRITLYMRPPGGVAP
jgi:hypothetical protein